MKLVFCPLYGRGSSPASPLSSQTGSLKKKPNPPRTTTAATHTRVLVCTQTEASQQKASTDGVVTEEAPEPCSNTPNTAVGTEPGGEPGGDVGPGAELLCWAPQGPAAVLSLSSLPPGGTQKRTEEQGFLEAVRLL